MKYTSKGTSVNIGVAPPDKTSPLNFNYSNLATVVVTLLIATSIAIKFGVISGSTGIIENETLPQRLGRRNVDQEVH